MILKRHIMSCIHTYICMNINIFCNKLQTYFNNYKYLYNLRLILKILLKDRTGTMDYISNWLFDLIVTLLSLQFLN